MPSNISRINGLSIDAASAQYVAAGNVDGPLGNNSVELSNTASYIDPTFISASAAASGFGSGGGSVTASVALSASVSQTTDTSYRVVLADLSGDSTYNTALHIDHNGITYNADTNTLTVGQLSATGLTGSFAGTITNATSASYAVTASRLQTVNAIVADNGSAITISASNPVTKFVVDVPGNIELNSGASIIFGGSVSLPAGTSVATASYVLNAVSSSFASTASYVNQLNQNVTINGNLQVFGTASYSYVSASQLDVGTNTISVNVAEPAERFGGLLVYDSGSNQATASLLWDSLNNHWVYQNASGSTYSGGMLISGPRNLGAIGDEVGTTFNALMKGQGGDHITSSGIFDNGTDVYTNRNVQITGSLTVTGNVIATASWTSNAVTALTSSVTYQTDAGSYPLVYVNGTGNQPLNISPYGAVYNPTLNSISNISSITASFGFQGTASNATQALTASYIDPTFISASAAASGFGSGEGGGVTSITAGDGISVNQSTGNVTITNTGGGGGGTNLGLVYAVSLGYLMP